MIAVWVSKIRRLFHRGRGRWFQMVPVAPSTDPIVILVRGLDGVDRQLEISPAESEAISKRATRVGLHQALNEFLVS